MPSRIIALYVLLCIRVLTNGAGFIGAIPITTPAAQFTFSVGLLEFAASLFILIALYHRKTWVISAFQIYMAVAIPASLFIMWIMATAAAQKGEPFAWNTFYGGVIGALVFLWFAWYVGRGPTRDFLAGTWRDTTPP